MVSLGPAFSAPWPDALEHDLHLASRPPAPSEIFYREALSSSSLVCKRFIRLPRSPFARYKRRRPSSADLPTPAPPPSPFSRPWHRRSPPIHTPTHMAARNGESHTETSASERSSADPQGPSKSSSPVPSPGSEDNGRRGRSRTRVRATSRGDDAMKRR